MIGLIGGSGLDNPDILQNASDIERSTSYGIPSSPIKVGTIAGNEVAIIARHGREHTIPPSRVNNRANIMALKQIGCDVILATTAVGSLREEIKRGDLVIVDQFIDFTRRRDLTFYDSFNPHSPVHIAMAEPFDVELREKLISGCRKLMLPYHERGTVITIEGPRFSTRAESKMFRLWGADIINMSIAPETILANEVGIKYAAVAMSTDYDCWKLDEVPVSWEEVLHVFSTNAGNVTKLLCEVIKSIQ